MEVGEGVAMILVSGCLIGINCKYNGGHNLTEELLRTLKNKGIAPVCPEQLGGLATPRVPAEIVGGDGASVLDGYGRVVNKNGEEVTEAFIKGAQETLRLAQLLDVDTAVLKARSPSCGCGAIYDGTFSGELKQGDGVAAALLKRNGIAVFTEENFPEKV